jgi:two-component system LytT family response regulator
MDRIRALIVDDEPLAREGTRELLRAADAVQVIGECTNGRDAVEMIRRARPDLVFLDVQMPEMNGFEVLEALEEAEIPPTVIFVTAYDEYALRAFEVHALDYLLKPLDPERFSQALQRAREQLELRRKGETSERIVEMLREIRSRPEHLDRFLVKSKGRVHFIDASGIDWIEAAGNYVKLHTAGDSYLIRETMTALEGRLDPRQFLRIHRSSIVNIDRVKELHPMFGGEYTVVLKDGTELTLSRTYRSKLQGRLGSYL